MAAVTRTLMVVALAGLVMAGLTGTRAGAQGWVDGPASSSAAAPDAASAHARFDALLKKHVKDGHVSYAGFQADEKELDEYLQYFARTDPSKLTKPERFAFWINAYNAYTIKLILRKYPKLKSIKDFWGPWDKQDWVVNGTKRSLNYMEHQVLRKMGDPRIHAAINCASKSCPDLASEAFTAADLDAQLTRVMTRFLADPKKGMRVATEPGLVYGKNHNVYLSSIFSWFGADFGPNEPAILEAIEPYMSSESRTFVEQHAGDLDVKYMSYDWTLNGE